MVLDQISVLLDDVGDFGLGKAVSQNSSFCLHLMVQFRVLFDDFGDFTFEIRPNLLFELDYVLGFIQLVFE